MESSADFEAFHEVLAHLGGHVGGDLHAHGVGETAGAKFLLHDFEKILGIIDFGVDFGGAGDAEVAMLEDFHAGEEGLEAGFDEAFDGHEDVGVLAVDVFLEGQPAGEEVGDFDAGEEVFLRAGYGLAFEEDADGERTDWR